MGLGGLDPRERMVIRDGVLQALEATFRPRYEAMTRGRREGTASRERGYELIAKAEEVVDGRGLDEVLLIPDVAESLRVSERTLQRVFRAWVGVGPLRYFTLRRMHVFRRRLLGGRRGRGAIGEAAAATGFTHAGRLSRDYKALFGESPRETLRRKGEPGVT